MNVLRRLFGSPWPTEEDLNRDHLEAFGHRPRNPELYLYRCTECGKLSVSLGWLHAHCEKHRGWGIGPARIVPPWRLGDFDALMEMTEVIHVTEYELVEVEDVPDRMVADGGSELSDRERLDPEENPFACSICGAPLGIVKRVRGADYCDGCLRDVGVLPPDNKLAKEDEEACR